MYSVWIEVTTQVMPPCLKKKNKTNKKTPCYHNNLTLCFITMVILRNYYILCMFGAGAPVHLVPSSGWDPSSPHNLSVCLIMFNSSIPSVHTAKAGERGGYHLGLWCFPHHRGTCMTRWVKPPLYFCNCTASDSISRGFPFADCSAGGTALTCLSLLFPCWLSRKKRFQLEQNPSEWEAAQRQEAVPGGGW